MLSIPVFLQAAALAENLALASTPTEPLRYPAALAAIPLFQRAHSRALPLPPHLPTPGDYLDWYTHAHPSVTPATPRVAVLLYRKVLP